jgi:hypothetical protein
MLRIFVTAFLLLCGPLWASAQIISSSNLGCTVGTPSGGMVCTGIGRVPDAEDKEKKLPKLFVTHFIMKPGAALDRAQTGCSSDCLIIGINGGDLLNEQAPFLHVSLAKDSVTLMPKEQPFHLSNKGPDDVEFCLIAVQRH